MMIFWKKILLNKIISKFILPSSLVSIGLAGGLYQYNNINNQKVVYCKTQADDLELKAIMCQKFIRKYKEEHGIPGIMVSITKNGEKVFSKGLGYSDVENLVRANANTVARIASISKPISCLIAAKLYEDKKLDLDLSIDNYLPDLPKFKHNNKEYKITTRQLISHTSGIRHYDKLNKDKEKNENNRKEEKKKNDNSSQGDTAFQEFYIKDNFKTTKDALQIFINDELFYEPGSKFLYTTYGYTLLSAILEKLYDDTSFGKLLQDLFKFLKMDETYLDQNDPLIKNRAKYYSRNDKSKLVNVPYVDNSYKWAGGGILSTSNDLVKLGTYLLSLYQSEDTDKNKFLKSSTIKSVLWAHQANPEDKTTINKNYFVDEDSKLSYGLGWFVCLNKNNGNINYVYHTGGAVGATSCLLIKPDKNVKNDNNKPVQGVVVAVLCNYQDTTEISKFTLQLAKIFAEEE